MGFTKITPADLQGKGVVGLPDTPQLSALAMQQKFDEIANDVIVPKFNNLVDELDTQGGTNIEVTDPTTSTTDTLQNTLDHIEAENALNTADRHNHANKATLDDIDATTKQGYDDLVTLMTNITGIDDVALSSDNDKIPTSKSVDDAIDTVQSEVSLNTAARHTHTNKSVLDAITGTMTTAWDALVTLFTGISAVEKTTLDNSVSKIPNDKVVKDAIDTVQAEVNLNTAARHTHTNKATLDAIDSTTKNAYDSLVTNYGSTSLEQTVTNDADKIPSGAAVVDYVSALGGGDMLKATYDTNDDGTVDSADYATNAGHATTADSATSATSAASATYATSAGSATSATTATSATNADYATSAGDSNKLGGKYSSFYAEAGDLQTLFGDVATYQSTSTALRNYAVGDFMIYENNFYEVTQAIASGGTIVKNTNVTKKTVGEVLTALASATPADMTGATSLLPGTHGLVPAPAAGDQDKVLKGDGTWGTVDASTVRYVPSTDKVQLWDGSDWVNWKTAGLLTPIQLIPLMTSNTSPSGRASFICENYGSRDYFTGTKNNVNVTSVNVRLATIQNYAYLGFINTEPYPSTASYITCGGGEEGEGTTWGVQYEFDDIRTIKYMTVGTWSYGSTTGNTGRATFRIYTRDATTNIWTARYTNDVTTSAADGGYNNGYSIVGNIAIDTENVNGIKVVMENIRCRNSYVGDIRAFGY